MQIVNPLYDHAFKYLMLNERYAKRILELILEDEILELSLSNQETVVPDEKRNFTLFRLDFKAVIRTKDGGSKTVLIELQKSKYATDIVRFRNYLGANYLSTSYKIDNPSKDLDENSAEEYENKETYPIVTIYILGYKLSDLPYLAVSVKRKIVNSIDKSEIDANSFFVNQLTHESHILQIKRLPEKRVTGLEQFLSLFNQAWVADRKYILDMEEIPEAFADIANYLQRPVADEQFRRRLEVEDEIDALFNAQEAKYLKEIATAKADAEEAKLREEEAKLREEEAELRASVAMLKLAKQMKKYGEELDDIVRETGLSLDEINNL
jgi:hypothetical protein